MHYTPEQIKEKINYLRVDEIMERFDFEKVHEYMVATDWKWIGEVPDLNKIKTKAYSLLMQAVDEFYKTQQPYGNIGTGGFMVYYFPWGMELVFKLEYSSTW